MSYQVVDDSNQEASDIFAKTGQELHGKVIDHDHINTEGRASLVQKPIPQKLPWYGFAATNSSPIKPPVDEINADAMPMQHQLHSNTKSHQVGGIYESYSRLE